jgi:pimeloyl-ACP methyl ester carboxylesterase
LPLAFRLMQYRIGRELIASIDNTPLIREGLRRNAGNPAVITEPFIQRWAALQRAPGHRRILMSINLGGLVTTKEQLAKIAVPTLILWGAADPILPVDGARRFADAIPGSELITYPGVGHLPQIEIPDRSAADVESFLLRHPAT